MLTKYLLCSFLILTGVAIMVDAQPQSPAATRLPLKPCSVPRLNEEVLCGAYEVFENRSTKRGRKIPLNVVVLPALSANPAPDPLFVLVGGPGSAATDNAAGEAQRFAEIRRERDIVLVDQRGTGRSNQLNCKLGGLNEIVQSFVAGEFVSESIKQCRAELEKQADLAQYTTPVAMDDLDEVRAWLGYRQINIYGGSYGARAALVYLNRHEKNVRSVTIRALPPANPVQYLIDTQRAIDLVFSDCANDPACAKAVPNLRQDWQTLFDRLAKSPVTIKAKDPRSGEQVDVTITRDVFAGGMRRILYDTNNQPQIPAGIQRFLTGNLQPFERVVQMTMGVLDGFSLGMFLSVSCAESASLVSTEELDRASQTSFLGDGLVKGMVQACEEWPKGKLPKDFFKPVRSNVPVLILSGNIDPVGPPSSGAEVAKHLPNSLHIVMEGIGHSPFPPCTVNIMSQFVVTGGNKGLTTDCLKEMRRPQFQLPAR